MKKTLLFIFISLAFIITSCKNFTSEPEEPVSNSVLKGKVIVDNQPVSGALIQLDEVANWKATTDSAGNFQISKVTEGTHSFKLSKLLDNNKIITQETTISINGNVNDLGTIKLPKPSIINQIDTSQVSATGIPLIWSKSSDSEFIEYRIYRKNVPGFDDKTGNLVYATTSISDTQFIDRSFETGIFYYYRVYIITYDGKKGGSNIVSTSTPPKVNFLSNGSFEESANGVLPDYWQQNTDGNASFNYYSVSSQKSKVGNKSIKITFIDSLSTPHPIYGSGATLNQKIFTNNFVVGKNYFFSFWSKSEKGRYIIRLYKNDDFSQPIISYTIQEGQDWTESKFTFNIDANTTSLAISIYAGGNSSTNSLITAWLDDIRITE